MIKQGNTVKVHYTGKFENDEVFDSSTGRQPIEFTIGNSEIIPGFENAVLGLQVGESVSVTISPEEGYGLVNEELKIRLDKTQVPSDVEVNSELQGMTETGEYFTVRVVDVNEEYVLVDSNHPLSGKVLKFDIEVVEVN